MIQNTPAPHLNITPDQIKSATLAILSGDPARVEKLALTIDPNAIRLSDYRGYKTYLAEFNQQQIVFSTSGIGGPSMAIIVRELAACGVQSFLRVGTTGAISKNVKIGDIIIAQAAVRFDGTSKDYAPIEFPAVADLKMTSLLEQALSNSKTNIHTGIVATTSSFYPGQSRSGADENNLPYSLELQTRINLLRNLNVLSFEMECATLFTITQSMGLAAAAYLPVVANRNHNENILTDPLEHTADFYAINELKQFLTLFY